jgi:hypothetical protein
MNLVRRQLAFGVGVFCSCALAAFVLNRPARVPAVTLLRKWSILTQTPFIYDPPVRGTDFSPELECLATVLETATHFTPAPVEASRKAWRLLQPAIKADTGILIQTESVAPGREIVFVRVDGHARVPPRSVPLPSFYGPLRK